MVKKKRITPNKAMPMGDGMHERMENAPLKPDSEMKGMRKFMSGNAGGTSGMEVDQKIPKYPKKKAKKK